MITIGFDWFGLALIGWIGAEGIGVFGLPGVIVATGCGNAIITKRTISMGVILRKITNFAKDPKGFRRLPG